MLSAARLARRAITTTARQRQLPRLPVPRLEDTLQKYTRSLQPFVDDDAERLGLSVAEEVEKRDRLARTFRDGLGKTLQERLIELDKQSPYNWLDDNFWLKKAYLEVRAPLPIHSNWWLLYKDDPNTPELTEESEEGKATTAQLARAAWLTWRTLLFRQKLQKEEIYPESSRTGSWVRPNALKMFNMHRIPAHGCDRLERILPEDLSAHEGARHILVLVSDWTYAVEVYTPTGEIVPLRHIYEQLHSVALDVYNRRSRGDIPPRIAILTSDDRDSWAKVRNCERLRNLSSTNAASLRLVEQSVFALSLDTYDFPPTKPHSSFLNPYLDAHLCNVKIGRHGANRWFDKSLTICVEASGRAGMMGEHSPCDALVPSMIADWTLEESLDSESLSCSDSDLTEAGAPRRLDFQVDATLEAEIERVTVQTRALGEDSDNSMLCFDEYGTEWIKENVKLSPDSYVQMALQLAWYKDQGYFTATYETALTRFFLHGRTETIRSFSAESRLFVKAMTDPSCPPSVRFARLRDAITVHTSYSRAALQGKGVDRHLLGLRLLMQDGERAEIFEDDLFARSQDWRLSTSGLTPGERFMGTGFGSPLPNGYGIPYLSGPNLLRFGIESKVSCSATSTERYKLHLVESLREMKKMCEVALRQESARL
ncbi:acyltransferase ChoActase/COT/CPT [Exidia glandulosa HHB12029]|uniref:Acyltransferase ChoActase/COT/CPT n=1 Tax=Exidia glandulosa HHB12029 TaxID=1314781 RepID=A0A165L7Z8_EXIGL|nr:acyltransferase ChoActase/COT/CPT [Exidia glandulosa HHB12029]